MPDRGRGRLKDASSLSLSKYSTFNTRICRPMGLSEEERGKVVRSIDGIAIRHAQYHRSVALSHTTPLPTRCGARTRWPRVG